MPKLTLQESVQGFSEVRYPKVTRNSKSYEQTEEDIHADVTRYLEIYRNLDNVDQRARLTRDKIDFLLRRYHDYAIEGNIGAHYRQRGVRVQDCDFEHVIPQAKIRDLLIQGCITVRQAMNPPTCWLDKDLHKQLKDEGWASRTPDIWNFWKRYTNVFDAEFETHNGVIVDTSAWDLGKHFEYFGVQQ
jgi:hypothetical protein